MTGHIDFAFLHGAGQGGWVWRDAIAAMERQAGGRFGRALALDVPGCGEKRGRAAPEFGPDEIATELIADIEAAGLSEVVLVGHSLAGTVLPRMAEQKPELFRRLVYVAAAAPPPGRTYHQRPDDEAAPPARPQPPAGLAALRELMRTMLCNDMAPEEAEAFLARLGQDAWPEAMSRFTAWRYDHLGRIPASYFVCLRDGIMSTGAQEALAQRLKADRLARLDAGHQVMITRPHAFAEALLAEARA